ncbi:MAG: hypothetical protein NTU73_09840, partial [Ignavibacteriae bacterium]|nr:hypothetical protein [Ignavibacteriota bacterium]
MRGGDLDWIYSTDSTGHTYHIFAMTPEVGIVDFWPPQSNILPEAQTCFEMNKYICLVAGAYTGLKSATLNKTNYTQNETGNMKVVLRNKGLMNATNVKVTFTPLSSYVTIPVQVYNKASLPSRTSDSTTFNFTVSGTCPNNYGIPTRLKIMQNDTIVLYNQVYNILVGSGITTFADSAENGTTNWTIGTGWSITTAQYHSPTHSFLNTPSNSANTSMSLNFPLNLASYPACYLEYWNRYDAENGFDFC